MPVWGFADVVLSNAEGVQAGERFYGYFPIASHIRMQAVRISARGFYDGAEHRRSLTSAYNQYMRCSSDPAYVKQDENYQMIVRPLFITSFMGADFLQDNDFFGAAQIVVSSASSKTAYGTAFCLKDKYDIKLLGLTSRGNRAFVEGLGCYDDSMTYDDVTSISKARPTLYLDFSGDESLRAAIHHHFDAALVYDCFAGSAQNTEFLRDAGLPGPKPEFYFAPVQIRKRNADWGHDVVNQRFNDAQRDFIRRIGDPAKPWMRVVESHGYPEGQKLIANMHGGRIDPSKGHVLVLLAAVRSRDGWRPNYSPNNRTIGQRGIVPPVLLHWRLPKRFRRRAAAGDALKSAHVSAHPLHPYRQRFCADCSRQCCRYLP